MNPSSRTPPIQFIPVFEAAARHLSFKKAAAELNVTAPAVGQQVKAFEQWLGEALFLRHTRSLSLTEAGAYYYQVAHQMMQQHRQGYMGFQRRFQNRSLHVSAPLFIAQELLMPNYLGFAEQAADTELRIEARNRYVDFETEQVDAAIRFGDGNWPELYSQRLCYSAVTPVCSPVYAAAHSFAELQDLSQHRLISESEDMATWQTFLAPDTQIHLDNRIICDSHFAAVKAAADGLGIALAILPIANRWINDGRLVTPFPLQYQTDKGYWLVTPKHNQDKAEITALLAWLTQLFRQIPELTSALPDG
ncbi:LysR substrate-binding domain-containing protein [Bacterioplanoides sp.]|uniref:LysR substrate-binding domain-containing protein n=1 Tax=Bacterioplanoides sp. TaxID=2066072 RepID=UPI003AFFA776